MSLRNSFSIMSGVLTNKNESILISQDEYDIFKKQWIVDALKGMRYGESFCKFFDLSNSTPLYFFKETSLSERWIKDFYLKK